MPRLSPSLRSGPLLAAAAWLALVPAGASQAVTVKHGDGPPTLSATVEGPSWFDLALTWPAGRGAPTITFFFDDVADHTPQGSVFEAFARSVATTPGSNDPGATLIVQTETLPVVPAPPALAVSLTIVGVLLVLRARNRRRERTFHVLAR